jgi:hypothetical protein
MTPEAIDLLMRTVKAMPTANMPWGNDTTLIYKSDLTELCEQALANVDYNGAKASLEEAFRDERDELERVNEELRKDLESNRKLLELQQHYWRELNETLLRKQSLIKKLAMLFVDSGTSWLCPSCGPTGCTHLGCCTECGMRIDDRQPDDTLLNEIQKESKA